MQDTVYKNTIQDLRQNSRSEACNEVLNAIHELKVSLEKKQLEGNLSPEIAANLQAKLDSLTSSTINFQQNQIK